MGSGFTGLKTSRTEGINRLPNSQEPVECEEPHSHCKALQLWGAQVSCGGTVLQGTLLYVRPSGLLSRSAPGDHLGKSVLFLSPGHYSSPSIANAVHGWECSRTAS